MIKTYYLSEHWQALRRAALARDGGRCRWPGCNSHATHVDHIQPRPRGAAGPSGADRLDNLQSLCRSHHSSKTAQSDGGFGHARGGAVKVKGARADGSPLDPSHWWNSRSKD
jgi:5-methylcytosine-specific restriction endonuclease McrA